MEVSRVGRSVLEDVIISCFGSSQGPASLLVVARPEQRQHPSETRRLLGNSASRFLMIWWGSAPSGCYQGPDPWTVGDWVATRPPTNARVLVPDLQPRHGVSCTAGSGVERRVARALPSRDASSVLGTSCGHR